MMRSLFAGVTGLRTHQTRMDVLGNNISNVNTIGYKKSVANFADLYSDTLSSAQAPTGTNGSVNAKQIGLGVGANSITTKHNQGAPQYTGNPLDLAITGDGFFVLRTPSGNQFSRAGDFKIGTTGYLENQNGYYVQGYGVKYQQGTAGESTVPGIDSVKSSNLKVFKFDNTAAYNVDGTQNPCTTTSAGNYRLEVLPAAAGNPPTFKIYKNGNDLYPEETGIPADAMPQITLNNAEATPITGPVEDGTSIRVRIPGLGDFTMTVESKTAQLDANGNKEMGPDGKPIMVSGAPIDVDNLYQQIAGTINSMDIVIKNDDGFASTPALGDIVIDQRAYENVSITSEGQVVAQVKESGIPDIDGAPRMAKGERVILGYITLATFPNTEGLEKSSTNMFTQTPGSGQATFNLVNQNGAGGLTTSSLEMSNVDLSDEMVSVITTQRGFQANSRIITVSDTLLEELINLKR